MIWGYLQLRKLSYDSTLPCFTTISIKIFTIASHNHLNLSSISVLILSRTFRHTNPSLIHRRVKMIPSPCCQHQRVLPAHATMIHPFTTSPARCHPFSSLVTIISPSFHHHFTITARTQNSHVRWSNMTCLHVDSHWFNPTFCFLNSRVSCQNTQLMLVGQITSSAVFKSQFVLLQAPFFQVKYPCHEKKPSSGPFGQIHGLRQRQRWPWQDPGCWGPSVGICQYYNRVRRDSFYGHYADMISMAISGITSIYIYICITYIYIYTLIYIYIH